MGVLTFVSEGDLDTKTIALIVERFKHYAVQLTLLTIDHTACCDERYITI